MIRVKSLGHIIHDASFVLYAQGKPVLVPVGYEIERPIFICAADEERMKKKKPAEVLLSFKGGETQSQSQQQGPHEDITFTATVTERSLGAGKTPTYVITRSDDPQHKVYSSSASINAAWRAAIEDAEKDFPEKKDKSLAIRDSKNHLQANGLRLFALVYAEVQAEVKALAGATEALAAFPPPVSATKAKHAPVGEADVEMELEVLAPSVDVDASQTKQTPRTTAAKKKTESGKTASARAQGNGASPSSSQTRKRSRAASAAPAPEDESTDGVKTAAEEGEGKNTPAKPRARKSSAKKAGDAEAAVEGQAARGAAAAVCPDCGLAGTPFCAATGKPHAQQPVCSLCGLATAFCPVSGQPHAGSAQRPHRQRGEVHLPGKPSTRRKRTAAVTTTGAGASGTDGVSEVVTVSSQDPVSTDGTVKKRRAKRARSTVDGTMPASEGGDGVAPMKKPRAKRGAAATGLKAGVAAAGQPTLDAALVPKATEPPKPPEFEYPPLRPPLSLSEQHRAAALQSKLWKERSEQQAECPPHISSLHLPFVAYRPPRQAGVSAAAKKKRQKAKQEEEDGADNSTDGKEKDNADEGDDEDRESDGGHGEDGDGVDEDKQKQNEDGGSAGKRPKKAAPQPVIMIHPLEVRDAATSVAGRRLTKFLQQYTSERTKADLLRTAENEKKAATATKKSQLKKTVDLVDGPMAAEDGKVTEENGEDGANATADAPKEQPHAEEEELQENAASKNTAAAKEE